MELGRIERKQKIASMKKEIVMTQKKLNETGKERDTKAVLSKRIRLHDKITKISKEIREIKKNSRRHTPILIEEIKNLSKELNRFDYIDVYHDRSLPYLIKDKSFNTSLTMRKTEIIGKELKIEKELKIKPDHFSKSLHVILLKSKAPKIKNANGELEEAPVEDKKYFGNNLEHCDGAQYLKKNFKEIFLEFYLEMEIDYDFKFITMTFVVNRHSFIEKFLSFKYILNDYEIVVDMKIDIDKIASVKDYEEIELMVLEKYKVFYAILVGISYEDEFYID